jgi:hypothetical protein
MKRAIGGTGDEFEKVTAEHGCELKTAGLIKALRRDSAVDKGGTGPELRGTPGFTAPLTFTPKS